MPLEEAPYSNRQIERMFDTQKESFDNQLKAQSADIKEHIDAALKPILTQTTLTNGRVGVLERETSSLKESRTWIKGGAYFFIPAFLAVAGWIIKTQLGL